MQASRKPPSMSRISLSRLEGVSKKGLVFTNAVGHPVDVHNLRHRSSRVCSSGQVCLACALRPATQCCYSPPQSRHAPQGRLGATRAQSDQCNEGHLQSRPALSTRRGDGGDGPPARTLIWPGLLSNRSGGTNQGDPRETWEPLRHGLEVWQERQDLNPRPAVLETAALPG